MARPKIRKRLLPIGFRSPASTGKLKNLKRGLPKPKRRRRRRRGRKIQRGKKQ